ncbi:hypothetical protein OAO87_01345 [bacterium]|nr:hypothetical protein [bacterium]
MADWRSLKLDAAEPTVSFAPATLADGDSLPPLLCGFFQSETHAASFHALRSASCMSLSPLQEAEDEDEEVQNSLQSNAMQSDVLAPADSRR